MPLMLVFNIFCVRQRLAKCFAQYFGVVNACPKSSIKDNSCFLATLILTLSRYLPTELENRGSYHFDETTQLAFTYPKITIETLEKSVKYVRS